VKANRSLRTGSGEGEGHETLEGTAFAPHAREASAEDATGEELSELALDEVRQVASIGAHGDLGAEGLEMLADDAMEHRALRGAGLVARGTTVRCPSQLHAAPGATRKQATPHGVADGSQRRLQHAVARGHPRVGREVTGGCSHCDFLAANGTNYRVTGRESPA